MNEVPIQGRPLGPGGRIGPGGVARGVAAMRKLLRDIARAFMIRAFLRRDCGANPGGFDVRAEHEVSQTAGKSITEGAELTERLEENTPKTGARSRPRRFA